MMTRSDTRLTKVTKTRLQGWPRLTADQRAERIRTVRQDIADDVPPKVIAGKFGLTHAGLIVWLERNFPEVREDLRTYKPGGGRGGLPREQTVARLKVAVELERLKLSPYALAKWLERNAPDGAADALADFEDEDYPAGHDAPG